MYTIQNFQNKNLKDSGLEIK